MNKLEKLIKWLEKRDLKYLLPQTILFEAKQLLRESEWINVNEELPEITEPLMGYDDENIRIVIVENHHVTVMAHSLSLGVIKAEFDKRGWTEVSSLSSKKITDVTHWQPLPQKPNTK